ncbi:MAG: thiamine pyrophosphate-dependent dehydrogenase component subunit alpha [Rhodospirillales bacterium]|jgi:TPP-dependent pyruvate/acetoin dehydrogenase alpha subunit|nr:thiamine pyrophosphate-dependent dehydrogenase component subunit alpha [Rhodospirillales bacterium]
MTTTPGGMPAHELLAIYRAMVLIRQFEEQVRRLAAAGVIPGLVHLCAGQEATAVGICAALAPDDVIASSHRGHGHCLAKGASADRLMAEILGRQAGYCRGRSGSLHVSDAATYNLGTNGIVGGGVPLATGAALSAKVRGTKQVAVCFFGDGALNQGIVFEAMNMAAIWALPVLFVCENNGYGEYTAIADVAAGRSLTGRGEVFDIPSPMIDGMDIVAVHDAARIAVERARGGSGPSFLVCNTWRYGGHHAGDKQGYKDRDEIAAWEAKDPILRLARELVAAGVADRAALDAIGRDVASEVKAAVDFARASPEPDIADLRSQVFA